MRKLLPITLALLIILILLTVSVHANVQAVQATDQATDPETVIRTIIAALNAGDVDEAIKLIADDAVLVHLPPPPGFQSAMDKEMLRTWWNEFAGRHGHIEITEIHVYGDKVAYSANISEDFFTTQGVPIMVANFVAIVQDGLLHSFTISFTKASQAIFGAALMRENNRTILQRAYTEVFNQGKLELLDKLIAPEAIDHSFPDLKGVDAFKTPISGLLKAFPDLQVTANLLVADGDSVMALATFTGTQQAEFLGVPPTGKQITWSHVDINRIKDGKVVEAWHIGAPQAILEALGYQLVPPAK